MALLGSHILRQIAGHPEGGQDKPYGQVLRSLGEFQCEVAKAFSEPSDRRLLLAKLLEKTLDGALTKIKSAHASREIERGITRENEREG